MKSKTITFTLVREIRDLQKNEPASKHVPEWYKNIILYMNSKSTR